LAFRAGLMANTAVPTVVPQRNDDDAAATNVVTFSVICWGCGMSLVVQPSDDEEVEESFTCPHCSAATELWKCETQSIVGDGIMQHKDVERRTGSGRFSFFRHACRWISPGCCHACHMLKPSLLRQLGRLFRVAVPVLTLLIVFGGLLVFTPVLFAPFPNGWPKTVFGRGTLVVMGVAILLALLLGAMVLWTHHRACTTDAGRSPTPQLKGPGSLDGWTFCHRCKCGRPPTAHHCRACGHCVQALDHHCVFIHTCVGAGNHRQFIVFLFWVIVGVGYCMFCACLAILCNGISGLLGIEHAATWTELMIDLDHAVTSLSLPPRGWVFLGVCILCFIFQLFCAMLVFLQLRGLSLSNHDDNQDDSQGLVRKVATRITNIPTSLRTIFKEPFGWRWVLPDARVRHMKEA